MDDAPTSTRQALGLVVRLAAISLVVGIVLSALDITPQNLLERLTLIGRHIYAMGFGWVSTVAGYVALGAMVVVPVWLILRLLGGRKT